MAMFVCDCGLQMEMRAKNMEAIEEHIANCKVALEASEDDSAEEIKSMISFIMPEASMTVVNNVASKLIGFENTMQEYYAQLEEHMVGDPEIVQTGILIKFMGELEMLKRSLNPNQYDNEVQTSLTKEVEEETLKPVPASLIDNSKESSRFLAGIEKRSDTDVE